MADFTLPPLPEDEGEKALAPQELQGGSFKPSSKKKKRDPKSLDIFEQQALKRKRLAAAGGTLGILTVGALVAGLLVFDPFGGDQGQGDQSSKTVDINSQVEAEDALAKEPFDEKGRARYYFWQDSTGNKYPVKLESWQKSAFIEGNVPLEAVEKTYSKGEFGHSTDRLPGKASGFTSDPKQARLPNGALNPLFSFVTAEDYRATVGSYIERLINPVYGGWTGAQYSDKRKNHNAASMDSFFDMFAGEYLAKHAKSSPQASIPIFADWNNNDYGMGNVLLSDGPRWIGKIENTKTKMVYNDKTLQYDSTVTVNVKYTAWTRDESTVTKNGVLTLEVATNTTDLSKPKLLIYDASLEMK